MTYLYLHAGKPEARRSSCVRLVKSNSVVYDSESEFRCIVVKADRHLRRPAMPYYVCQGLLQDAV